MKHIYSVRIYLIYILLIASGLHVSAQLITEQVLTPAEIQGRVIKNPMLRNFMSPPCNVPPSTRLACDAPVLCGFNEINGYCTTLENYQTGNTTFPGCGGNVLNNPIWFAFVSGATNVALDIVPSNCQGQPGGNVGIQAAIYNDCGTGNGAGPVFTQCGCTTSSISVSFTAVRGETYYVVIDGCGGDICDIQVRVTQGGENPQVGEFTLPISGPGISPNPPVCAGATVPSCITYSVDAPDAVVDWTWTIDGFDFGVTNAGQLEVPQLTAGTHQICVTGSNDCDENTQVCETITVEPVLDDMDYVCLCEEDFPYTYPPTGDVITSAGVINLARMNACGCPYNTVLTVESNGITPPVTVVDAICEGTFPYAIPDQDLGRTPPFTMSGTYNVWLDMTQTFNCSQGGQVLMCDEQVSLELIELVLRGQDSTIVFPCGATDVTIIPDNIFTAPVGDPNVVIDYEWFDAGGISLGTDPFLTVVAPGIYRLTVSISHLLDEYDNDVCGPLTIEYTVVDQSMPLPAPVVTGPQMVCVGDTANYMGSNNGGTEWDWQFFAPLGTIIAGNNTNQISVEWTTVGIDTLIVYSFVDCNISAITRYPVEVVGLPNVSAGTDETVCGDTVFTLNGSPGTGDGLWTLRNGPGPANFDDITDPNTQVSISMPGVYTFEYVETVRGCSNNGSVNITFSESPVINIDESICDISTTFYTVRASVSGGTGPYTWSSTPPGMLVGGQWVVEVPSGASYTINVTDNFGCPADEIMDSQSCNCTTEVGAMSTDLIEVCEGADINVSALDDGVADGNDIRLYYLHAGSGNALGTIYAVNDNGAFNYQTSFPLNDTIYVSLVIGNAVGTDSIDVRDGCRRIAPGQPVVWYEIPNANAGPDQDTQCGLEGNLSAIASIGAGSWTLVSGPGGALFDAPMSPMTQLTVDAYGTYTFRWTENNVICDDADEVMITFRDYPRFNPVPAFTCTSDNLNYQIDLAISGGDTVTYTVVDGNGVYGGTVTGTTFRSDLIPLSTDYFFIVSDQYDCRRDTIQGTPDCSCQTMVGEFTSVTEVLCAGETFPLTYVPGTATVDGNDIREWLVLNPADSSVVYVNPDSLFQFIPGVMTTGVQYLIISRVGNNNGSGTIDLSDPCAQLGIGSFVSWLEAPDGSISTSDPYCVGDLLEIVVSFTDAGLSYTIELSDGTTTSTLTGVRDGDRFSFPVTGPVTYRLISIAYEGGNGCRRQLDQDLLVTVNSSPEINLQDTLSTCNLNIIGDESIVDLGALILSGDMNGVWRDIDNSQAGGTLPVLDFEGRPGGTYRFEYTTRSALAPCPETVDTVTITVRDDCPCPEITTDPIGDLCTDFGNINLANFEQVTLPGTWSIISDPGGANPATIAGKTLTVLDRDPGVYVIEFKIDNFTPVCPDSSRQTITLIAPPEAGTPGVGPQFCQGDDQTINLGDYLTGADIGGIWDVFSAPSTTGIDLDQNTGAFRTRSLEPGVYTLRYIAQATPPCSNDEALVEVTINTPPVADAGDPLLFGCTIRSGFLGGPNTSQGADIVYQWYLGGAAIPGATAASYETSTAGTYMLEVINNVTGCRSTDDVIVDEDPNSLSGLDADIRNERCVGQQDGIVSIRNIVGGIPPYTVRFDGEERTSPFVFTDLVPGTYDVRVTDSDGCIFDTSINILSARPLDIIPIEDIDLNFGDSTDVLAIVNRDLQDLLRIEWLGGDPSDTSLQVVLQPEVTTNYTVRIIDLNGCEAMESFTIHVMKNNNLYAPNAFNPSGIENSVWRLFGNEVVYAEDLSIFDRWGDLVFQQAGQFDIDNVFWDGTLGGNQGTELAVGVYVFIVQVQYTDGTTERVAGDITLFR